MFYFAYGSNMNWVQMQHRCPSARFVCVARLPGYRFAIARHSRLRHCGTANVLPDARSTVWGIVYEVSENDMLTMDGFEDGYSRQIKSVFADNHGTISKVIVYIAPEETGVPLPSAEYKQLMIEGASYWQLPPDYCLMLNGLEAGRAEAGWKGLQQGGKESGRP
jgi:gamma-glutamylcyclotransferase (GGCT)/AIG2-like uncharacterized protein YtfP